MNIDQASIMADNESQCSSNSPSLLGVDSTPAIPATVDDCVGTQSSIDEGDGCASSSTLPDTSNKSLRTKRKSTDLEVTATKRPRSCAISLEMWKGQLLGVEDDLFDAVWSLHGGDTTYLGDHASDMGVFLADGISRELEHVVDVQQKHPALVGDTSLTHSGNSPGNLERQMTTEADEQEGGITESRTQIDLSAKDEATEFEWQLSLPGAANDPSPLPVRSCTVQPLSTSNHNIGVSSLRVSDKARTSHRDFTGAAVMPQPIHFDIVPIGSWGQMAGTTVGAVDVPLLCI